MANGLPLPDYYHVNAFTGLVSFDNSGDYVINDEIVIVISSNDQVQFPYVQRTQAFYVITECGPDSTDITRPQLYNLQQPANS